LKNNCIIPQYKSALLFIYGSFSGVLGTILLYPSYMIKRVLQANNDKSFSLMSYITSQLRTQGVKGFYLGMSMTLIKIIPYQGILFWTNEKIKVLLKY
jgi:hypothetical protein